MHICYGCCTTIICFFECHIAHVHAEQKSPYECHENVLTEKSHRKQKQQQQQDWLQCHSRAMLLQQRPKAHSDSSNSGGSSDNDDDDEEYDEHERCYWSSDNKNSCDKDIDNILTDDDYDATAAAGGDNDEVLPADDGLLTVPSLTYGHKTAATCELNKINRESKSVSNHCNLSSMPLATAPTTVTHFDNGNMTAAAAAAPASTTLTVLHTKQSHCRCDNSTNNSFCSCSSCNSNCHCNANNRAVDAAKNMPRHKSFGDGCFQNNDNNNNNNSHHVTQFSRSSIGSSKYLMNAHLNIMSDEDLVFESRFESGNLAKAIKITPVYYELYLRPDLYTNKHTQWFYFRVTNVKKGFTYR